MVLEEKAAEVEKELCEVLVRVSKAEQEFQNQKERAESLYRSTVRLPIKLGDKRLRMVEAHKRETQSVAEVEANMANIKRDHNVKVKELRE